MTRKPLTKDQALLKMASICARSEQCRFDIEKKLRNYGLSVENIGSVIEELEERRFLDERRYAAAFARDKVKFSAWGRFKIRAALAAKRVKPEIVTEALALIESEEYENAVKRAARAKAASLNLSSHDDRVKLYRHLLSRGFESDVALNGIKTMFRS